MKVKFPNGIEIECTPDEYEDLYTRGLFGGMGTGTEEDLWAENLKKIRDAPDRPVPGTEPYQIKPQKWPRPWDTVTVMYGVTTDGPWAQGDIKYGAFPASSMTATSAENKDDEKHD